MEKKGIAKSIEPFLEKIESLSQVQRIIISVGSFVVIAGIFIYFLYLPKYEKINSLKKQLTDLEQKLSTAKRNAADLKKFQAKPFRTLASKSVWNSYFLSPKKKRKRNSMLRSPWP